jgi:hypothetical protein
MTSPLALAGSPGPRTAEAAPPATLTVRAFLAAYARLLLPPLAGVAALLTGWTMAGGTGWLLTAAAVVGWSGAARCWLRHRGWPAATADLAGWAAPAALLAPLAGLGWLTADGLLLWGPVSAVLAVALVASHDPELLSRDLPRRGATRPATGR